MANKKIEVYYDGTCNLCSGLMDKIHTSAKGGNFTTIESSHGAGDIGMSAEQAMHEMHVRDKSGVMRSGVQAVFAIMEEYPRWRWLAQIGNLPGLRIVSSALYRVVAHTRYWLFGRKNVS